MTLPTLESLREAVEFGGFQDACETEEVSRWALKEIERLSEALEQIAAGSYSGPHAWAQTVARAALRGAQQ